MVQAIRDQWLIAAAIVAMMAIVVWLAIDRWKSGAWRRGRS
jgi:hypothetical protein